MTFLKNIQDIILDDDNDNWLIKEENGTCSVKFFGLSEMILRLFDYDLNKQFPDGWVDSYAIIDPIKQIVIELYFVITTNGNPEDDRELCVKLTNYPEQKAFYNRLRETACNEESFDGFIKEAAEEN